MTIAAILPCRGRHEQTVTNIRRLITTAGYNDWHLIAVGGTDEHVLLDTLEELGACQVLRSSEPRVSYWQALAGATAQTNAPLLINLANDLLPGQHWLRRAVDAYDQTFGSGPGMVGFNGDSHELEHSCHFMISRTLLERCGGWPVWYYHNFGDTELCQRAIGEGLYAKAPWALLYHDHVYWGGKDDEVYQEGRATVDRDAALFDWRQRRGWPPVTGATRGQPTMVTSAVPSVAWRSV